jgi:hypothetical protein
MTFPGEPPAWMVRYRRLLYVLSFLLFTGAGAVSVCSFYIVAKAKLQAINEHPEILTNQIDDLAGQWKLGHPLQIPDHGDE